MEVSSVQKGDVQDKCKGRAPVGAISSWLKCASLRNIYQSIGAQLSCAGLPFLLTF